MVELKNVSHSYCVNMNTLQGAGAECKTLNVFTGYLSDWMWVSEPKMSTQVSNKFNQLHFHFERFLFYG